MASHGSDDTFFALLALMYLLIPVTAIATTVISAPYGRHLKTGWGFPIPARLGWVLMESPAVWYTAWVFFSGRFSAEPMPRILLLVYLFPLRPPCRGVPDARQAPGQDHAHHCAHPGVPLQPAQRPPTRLPVGL